MVLLDGLRHALRRDGRKELERLAGPRRHEVDDHLARDDAIEPEPRNVHGLNLREGRGVSD